VKRGLYVALGVIFLVIGVALAGLGTTIALSVGSDDALSTAPARVRGTGVAVVAEEFRVDTSSIPVPQDLGSLTLTVTARDGRPMFVGAAQSSDVDNYLTGAPYDVVVDLTAGEKATTRKVPGGQQPQKPDSQSFWTAKSSGAPASLTARLSPGTTLVVMNADAAPEIDADVVVTLRVPKVWTYAWIVAGVGLLLLVLAVLLFWRARVAHRRSKAVATPAVPAASAALGTTVLPAVAEQPATQTPPLAATADSVVVTSADDADVIVAPASAGIAALVADAEAATEAEGEVDAEGAVEVDDGATTEIPVAAPVEPTTVESDGDAPTGGSHVEPLSVEDEAEPAGESDIAVDPVFEELVQAHGGDPVHDGLSEARAGAPSEAHSEAPSEAPSEVEAAPLPAARSDGPASSGAPPTDG
jgi:hypothetical protein